MSSVASAQAQKAGKALHLYLKKSVLDRCEREADAMGTIDAVWVHWKDDNYRQDDYVIMPAARFAGMVEALRASREDGEE